jgi:hypothetical protein
MWESRLAISKGGAKEWETCFRFSTLSTGRHFHRLLPRVNSQPSSQPDALCALNCRRAATEGSGCDPLYSRAARERLPTESRLEERLIALRATYRNECREVTFERADLGPFADMAGR